MYKVTTFSNRIYENSPKLNTESDVYVRLENNIVEFNRILFSVYNLIFLKYTNKQKFEDIIGRQSVFLYVRTKYKLNTYYANAIINLAHGKIKSQIELQKLYIEQIKEKIKNKEEQISKTQKFLHNLLKLEANIMEYRNQLKINPKSAKLKSVKGVPFIRINNNQIQIKLNKVWSHCGLGNLEYNYVLPLVRKQRNLLGKYRCRLNNLNIKLNSLQNLKHIIFGTKKYIKDYCRGSYSKLQFLQNKYKSYEIDGRCDFIGGNRMIQPIYNNQTNTIIFKITLINGEVLYLNDLKFPYRQLELVNIMSRCLGTVNNKAVGSPIACKIIHKYSNKRSYYQIAVTFDLEFITPNINYDVSTGIIALDFNFRHIDMTELDNKGNLVNHKTFYYDVFQSSYKNEISLRTALDKIVEYANSKYKIIAIENLDLTQLKTKFNSEKTKQRKLNRCLHSFPYSKFTNIMNYLRIKYQLDIIQVNPAFTSIIGKSKYSYCKKLNSHIAASYVVGRRALGIEDIPTKQQLQILSKIKPLSQYKSTWSMWSTLNKYNNQIKTV